MGLFLRRNLSCTWTDRPLRVTDGAVFILDPDAPRGCVRLAADDSQELDITRTYRGSTTKPRVTQTFLGRQMCTLSVFATLTYAHKFISSTRVLQRGSWDTELAGCPAVCAAPHRGL